MASKIDLISSAFLMLGTPTINSLNDGSSRANTASNLYDSTLDSLLATNRWRFAHTRLVLSQLVETPAHTYKYAYQLPSDMIMPISVYPRVDYEIYGDKLYTDSDTITLDYINRPDESKLPPYFLRCFELSLAAAFAMPITENRAIKESLQQDFLKALSGAMWADAQGRPPEPIMDNPLLDARW